MAATGKHPRLPEEDRRFDAVHADTLRFFPELVRALGGDPVKLVADAPLPPGGGLPNGYRSIALLMEHAAQRLGCVDFGLRLASLQGGGGVFGALGAVMRHASTLGAGLRYVADHSHAHSLAARVRIEPVQARRMMLVSHDILVERLPIKRQMVEQLMLLAQLNALEVSGGKARVREVRFRLPPLSPLADYRRYFGCDVRFDQSVDGILFSESDLHCPTVASDPGLLAEAKSFIASHHKLRPPMRAEVRALIIQLMGSGDCNKERVASALHLHSRTLHRRLADEGTCFEALIDGVRRDEAFGYLRATNLSIQRIAEKVGYAEQSVLARSCSRWFDASPRVVRRHGHVQEFVLKCRDRQRGSREAPYDHDPNT